jgi:hypothetical protein
MKHDLHPPGKHKLELVKVLQKDGHKVTLIFRGIKEKYPHVIMRTFRIHSTAFYSFSEKFIKKKDDPLETIGKLRGSIFSVKVGMASNNNFVNIEEFYNISG